MTTSTPSDPQAATDERRPAPDESGADQAAHEAAEAAAAQASRAGRSQGGRSRGGARNRAAVKAVVPVLAAILLTAGLQFLTNEVIDPASYLHRLFRPPGGWMMSLVPGIIFFLFVWTVADLLLMYQDSLGNESDLDRREIRQLPSLVAQEPIPAIQRRILAMDSPDRPVARRLLWLLYYLEHNADAQRTHELLRHQADLDADTAAGGYRTVKLFIWAMPILGFVGTVLGISLAVGGFSNFLTTNMDIEDVTRVTSELGNVASGLSFAFDTTLLGLLGGLFANTLLSGVQKRDERFFTRLEELGLSIVANSRPAGSDKTGAGQTGFDPGFEGVMHARIEEIEALVDRTRHVMQGLSETSARMSAGLGESMAAVRRTVEELSEMSKRMNAGLDESMASVRRTVEELSETSTRTGAGLNESMASVRRTVDDLGVSLQGVTDALAVDATSQAKVERAVQRLSESIASFGEGLAQLRAEQSTLTPVLQQLAGPLELRLVPGSGRSPGDGTPGGD